MSNERENVMRAKAYLDHFADLSDEVFYERVAQDKKWGVRDQDLAGGGCQFHGLPSAEAAQEACDKAAERGDISWTDILVEEVAEFVEAAESGDVLNARKELIQVAAVALAAIENIDRRGGSPS